MKKRSNFIFLIKIICLILLFLILSIYFIRFFLHTEIDDVTPGIKCEESLLKKSDVYYVIPLFENKSIADNPEWCSYIKSFNKTLALHGVYHKFNEFSTPRDSDYINIGVSAFEKCFGFKPDIFKAPQLSLSSSNKNLLESLGFKVRGKISQLMHKVYHCSDTGIFSNDFIDKF